MATETTSDKQAGKNRVEPLDAIQAAAEYGIDVAQLRDNLAQVVVVVDYVAVHDQAVLVIHDALRAIAGVGTLAAVHRPRFRITLSMTAIHLPDEHVRTATQAESRTIIRLAASTWTGRDALER